MGGFAWVTLATNDSYSLGALVLAHSLKNVRTSHQLAVLVTPGVTKSMREKLSGVFNIVQEVNILDSKDEANLRLLKRPELGVTFTKLHCWRLTQFDKCVFLDADTLVLKNSDELFDREELSAAPDVGWPDCFNSGVFVYRPSNQTYEKLVQFALETGSFDGGDQGLLNLYFSDWASKDISKHLPFIYNLCSTACYSYLPAFKQFGADTKIIHFIGSSKPWLQYFNTETQRVQPSSDLKHLEDILQHWWNIFCSLIHPQLTREMGGLAGAFAQLTLGAPRTAEQSALDDHLRRQGWEVGNIDYMGKDSFDNIWSKICETLSAGSPAEKTTEETPRTPAEEPVAPTATEAPPPAEPPKPVSETTQSIPLEPAAPTDAPQCPLPPKQETEPLQCPLKPKEGSQPVAAAIETFSPIIAKGTPEPVPVLTEQPPVVAPVALPTPPPEQVSVVPSAKEQVDAATEQAPIPATVQEQPSLPSPVPEHPSVPSPVTEQPQVVTPVVQQPPTVPTPATEEPKSATPVVEQPPAVASVTEQPPIATPVTEELPIAAPITKQLPIAAPVPEQPPLATAAPEQPPIAAPVPEQPPLAAAAPEQPPLAAAAPEQPPIAAAAPEQPPIAAAAPEQPPLAAAVPEQPKVATVPVSEQPPQRSGSEPTAEVLASSEAGSEQLKSVSKTKSEASGAAAASPTPPPRKSGGGGGKKPKTKK